MILNHESLVRMLITVIFPYRTGGRAVSLAGIVPKLCSSVTQGEDMLDSES